jgi:L-ascorbate metabolism protein UlaG (beta-lactamase superfamily)
VSSNGSIVLHFHGHACFELRAGGVSVLVDPFLAPNNPAATATADDVDPTHVVVTHGHGDHVADAIAVARRTGAPVVTIVEIAHWLGEQGLEAVDLNLGGRVDYDWGWVKLVQAFHTNTLPDGTAVGQAAGTLIRLADTTVYHCGDTALFGDMALIAAVDPVDVLIVPIGGHYTMDLHSAARAVGLVDPRIAIPAHYNTFPVIAADPQQFVAEVARHSDAEVRVMNPGDAIEV